MISKNNLGIVGQLLTREQIKAITGGAPCRIAVRDSNGGWVGWSECQYTVEQAQQAYELAYEFESGDHASGYCLPVAPILVNSHLSTGMSVSVDKLLYVKVSICKLEDYPYSFLILNQGKADFIKQIALKEIPRHLLFDKQGKLVYIRTHQDQLDKKS